MSLSIAIPFSLDESGTVAVASSDIEALSQRVTALASTQPGERVMAIPFGVDTASLLFNVDANSVLQMLTTGLMAKMKVYEPSAELTSVQPFMNTSGTGIAAIAATARPVASSSARSNSARVIIRADGTVVTLA